MPPKPKEPKKGNYKPGTPLKDLIPATIKQPPRDPRPIRLADYVPTNTIVNPYQPQPEFEDWPGDEAALNFDFGLESQTGKQYTDPVQFPVPPSFKTKESDIVFWQRPRELIKSELSTPAASFASLNSKPKVRRQKTGIDGELLQGRLSIDENSGLGPFDLEDVEITLFSYGEREETAEEAEQRVKELMEKQQQQKKKPPPGKKEEPLDTAPQKIKEVKLSNVSMRDEIPAYSKWIASQIQVIKDRNIRDVNTRKPIWTRIYPQKEGVPVINPSGRYWVKLYHMGKEKKIDIDDRVPVVYGNGLFAKSVNENEIWTFILSKALIKLNASRWNDPKAKDIEVGDGSIIYALTGYVPETISIPQNIQDKWKTISYALSDKKYDCGDKYLTCFSMPGFKPYAPSNKVRNPKDISLDSKRSAKRDSTKSQTIAPRGLSVPSKQLSDPAEPQSTSSIGSPSVKKKEPALTVVKSPRQDSTRREEGGRERPSNVITGFAYAIIDAFENDNFNMAYALKRSENEVKLRTDLANMQKISLNKMSREEKVEHRKLVKELKEKLAVEDAKRRELVKVPAEHYRLLKLKSSVGNVSALSFNTFDQDDVTLARKCILNKLSKPPNYELYDIKPDESKSVVSTANIETQKILPLDDFSRIENAKEPLKRPPGGTWVTDLDLEGCFQFLQVFHDPTRFKYRETHTLAARQDEELISYEDKEVIVIEAQTEEEEKEKDKDREHNTFLYSFSSTRPANMAVDPKPSLVLQKYDFLHFEVAQSYKPLNQVHDSNWLTLESKNQVFRVQLTSPLSCFLWISSDMHYKLMSMADFLCTYEGYHVKNQPIEYPVIEKNRYHLFYKGIINGLNQKEHIICRIKNTADAVMLRSVRIKLIELTNKEYTSEEDFATGVVTFPLEKAYYTSKSVPITLEPGKQYMIVVEGRMSETVNEGTLDFDIIYSDTEFNIETVEQVEPVEYMDKYVPTKYGVLFSERLFVNNEVQTSFFARISDVVGNGGQQQNAQKGKKGEVVQVEEKDISEQRTIKLELFRDDELVAFAFGQNKAVISNVALYPTNNKDEPRNYLLQARFDLREWPECKEENEFTSNLHWTLKVSSNDTVGVVRDTIKEDNVKAIKKSWEDKEPGRATNAKTARKKYLILAKIRRGEQVTQDELALVNEPRQKKNKEEDLKKDAKGKAPPPKGKPAPPVKGGKKDEAPVEEKKEDKPLPKSEDHVMSEICSFLAHMEQPRLLEESNEGKGPMVRTEEEQGELREKILLGREEVYGMTERNKLSKQKIKDILSGNKDKVLKDLQAKRQDNKEKISAIMKDREEFRKKDKEIKDRYRTVTALCRQEKPTLEEVVKALNEHAGYVEADLLKVLEKVRKNAYIGEKVDRMNAALVAYDIPTITAVLDEFRTEEIEIDEELYMKAEELIDMAEKNPTFIADKQKEAQKAQKGKKK